MVLRFFQMNIFLELCAESNLMMLLLQRPNCLQNAPHEKLPSADALRCPVQQACQALELPLACTLALRELAELPL